MWAIPPSANSVIAGTGIPRVLATAVCDSSCASSAAKKATAVTSAAVHTSMAGQFALTTYRWPASDTVMSAAMKNQL